MRSLVGSVEIAVLLGQTLIVVGVAYFSMALAMALVIIAGAAFLVLGLRAVIARR